MQDLNVTLEYIFEKEKYAKNAQSGGLKEI